MNRELQEHRARTAAIRSGAKTILGKDLPKAFDMLDALNKIVLAEDDAALRALDRHAILSIACLAQQHLAALLVEIVQAKEAEAN